MNPLEGIAGSSWMPRVGNWLLRGLRGEVCLVLLCLLVYVPGFFTMPTVDRDEARFVQASRQMLEADSWHGWIVPKVQERPRLQKPPLIYWTQAATAMVLSGRVFGPAYAGDDAVWMYRLPSLLAAIGTVLVTVRLARRIVAPPAALLAGAVLACSPIMAWEARQGRADMLMLFFTTLAVYGLWRSMERARWGRPAPTRWVLMTWISASLGVMTKGPVSLMVPALAILVLAALGGGWSVVRRMRPLLGAAIVLAPIAAWVVLLTREIDLEEYLLGVWRETGGRAASAMEGHWGPSGYHTLVAFAGLFPGCLMLGPGMFRAARRGLRTSGVGWMRVRNVRAAHAPTAFLLAVIVPSWIVFEVSGTKLPHYTLPLYPALSVLIARMVYAAPREARLRRPVLRALLWLFVAGVIAFAFAIPGVAGWMVLRGGDRENALGLLALGGLSGALFGGLSAAMLRARRFLALQVGALAMFVLSVVCLGWALGRWSDMRISSSLAEIVRNTDPKGERPVAAVAFHEDSLIFETHGRSRRVDEWKLKEWLTRNPEAIVVLDTERAAYWPRFAVLGEVAGLNYSNGKRVDLVVGEFLPARREVPR